MLHITQSQRTQSITNFHEIQLENFMAKLATRKSSSIFSLSDRKEAIKTSSGSMNESRHTNSHQGICIYSFSVHNMARNESKKGRNELKGLEVSVLYL